MFHNQLSRWHRGVFEQLRVELIQGAVTWEAEMFLRLRLRALGEFASCLLKGGDATPEG
jgi:hypothetical protein